MGLKQKGKIVEWNTSKGFGFIRSQFNSNDIFIHISDFREKQCKPRIGDVIFYEVGKGRDNKKKAIDAYIELNDNSIVKKMHVKKKSRNIFSNKRIFSLLSLGVLIIYSNFSKKNTVPIVSNEFIKNDIQDVDSFKDKEFDEYIKKQDKFIEEHSIKRTTRNYNPNDDKIFNEYIAKQNKRTEEHHVKRPIRSNNSKKNIKETTSKNNYRCDGREYCSQMKSCEEAKFFINNCRDTKMDGDGDGIPCEIQWCGH